MSDHKENIKNIIADFPAKKYSNLQFSSPDEIQKVQNKLLANHIEYVVNNSPFYKERFDEFGIDYRDIKTVFNLKKVPFTCKSDINEYNDRFCAVSREEVVDVCLTSATTGSKPTMLLQTQSDLARLAYNEEIAFSMTGISSKDVLLVCAALDRCFMAGLAYFLGGLKLSANVVRGGSGSAAQNWELIKITGATAIVGVPSLMQRIAEYAVENGESPSETCIERLIAIGEAVRDRDLNLLPLARKLEDIWGAQIYSTYASTELATTFCECSARQGGHLRPELIVLEIVDDNGNPVPDGEEGEIVVTPLGITGMPLVRFRTGDISFIINETCSCGRKTPRIAPILGRKNQMLKFKGTTIFPNSILSILEGKRYFHGCFVEARSNEDGTDRVILYASVNDPAVTKEMIKDELRARLRVVPEIVLITKKELDEKMHQPESKRKRIAFFDLRKR